MAVSDGHEPVCGLGIDSIAEAFVAAQMGRVQLAVAAKMMKMNAQSAQNVADLVQAAQQNFDRLANVAAGLGTNLEISA